MKFQQVDDHNYHQLRGPESFWIPTNRISLTLLEKNWQDSRWGLEGPARSARRACARIGRPAHVLGTSTKAQEHLHQDRSLSMYRIARARTPRQAAAAHQGNCPL
ncbi:unnamed protein product [Amoebophrya sp. A120]|nr:unnamed protein product [Amoebophrya sp. A120]|eukprot:GSA120T00010571001.1